MRLAVSGTHGQIARALQATAHKAGVEVLGFGRPEIDFATPDQVASAIESLRPDVVLNAAAYTAVDQAEHEADTAMRINGEGAAAMARAAAALGVPIIQLSTDYVFDGRLDRAYRENDLPHPLGVYGRSKLAGEQAVAQATPNHAILRTSWVYSPFRRNFVRTMLSIAEQKDEIRVVGDNCGAPTNAFDLADGILRVARNLVERSSTPELRGIFHLTNAGVASWAEFASEIFRLSASGGGPIARVVAIPSEEYTTPARRPVNSRLDNGKIACFHHVVLRDWRESLGDFMDRFAQDLQRDRSQ